MSKNNAGWENALTVLQEVRPPFIPEGAEVKTVVADLPPGSAGFPPHRHSGPSFYYMLEGELQFELEGEPPRVIRAGKRSGNRNDQASAVWSSRRSASHASSTAASAAAADDEERDTGSGACSAP